MSTIPETPHQATSEKELLGLMKAWRHGRATRSLWQALTDGYYVSFIVILVGAMGGNVILTSQRGAAACTSHGCSVARTLLPWALWAAMIGMTAAFARMFGPVLASAAEGFWLLDAPLRREKFLRSRLAGVVAGGGAVGALLGGLLAMMTGSAWPVVIAWVAATGLTTAAALAFAAAQQGANRELPVRILQALGVLAGVAVMVLVILNATGKVTLTLGAAATQTIPWTIAAIAALMLVVAYVVARARLRLIRRARLQSGGALVAGMQGAAFALDLGLMRDILVQRDSVRRGRVNPTNGRGQGITALIWRDAQRLRRQPKILVPVALSALVPYAVAALGMQPLNPLISGLVLCFCLVPSLQTMRVLARTPGLVRMFPFSTPRARQGALVVPGILVAVWMMAALPAFTAGMTADSPDVTGLFAYVFFTAFAGLMGGARWVTAGTTNYNAPMLATGAGALPPGLVANLFRGFDVVTVITLPLVLGAPWWVSMIVSFIVLGVVSGTFSPQELEAAQKAQQRELERSKAQHEQVVASRRGRTSSRR